MKIRFNAFGKFELVEGGKVLHSADTYKECLNMKHYKEFAREVR